MKVFVTGGAGFVGSHVAEYYAKRGDEVVVYDNVSRAKLPHHGVYTMGGGGREYHVAIGIIRVLGRTHR